MSKYRNYAMNVLLGSSIVMFILISVVIGQNTAYAKLESLAIDGPTKPLVNTLLTFKVHIEGISSSGGYHSVVATIYNKETGDEIHSWPMDLSTGLNTIQISQIAYSDSFNAGTTYVLKFQHVAQIWEFEFTPVATIEEASIKDDTTESEEEIKVSSPQTITPPSTIGDPTLKILGVIPTKFSDQFLVGFKICSGSKHLDKPRVTVNSDITSHTFSVVSVLGPGTCLNDDYSIVANNPESIQVKLENIVHTDVILEEMRTDIKELQEQMKKIVSALPFSEADSHFTQICIDKVWIESTKGRIACVTPTTAEKLVERGWGTLLEEIPMEESMKEHSYK